MISISLTSPTLVEGAIPVAAAGDIATDIFTVYKSC